jgi:hypothetical protein
LRSAGHDVITLRPVERNALRRLSQTLRFQLGDLAKEAPALLPMLRRDVDVVVCAEMGSMRALGLLRRAGMVRVPMIGLLHPAPPSTLLARWSVSGFDRVLCLSSAIERAVVGRDGTGTTTSVTWGPDLSYPGYRTQSAPVGGTGAIVCSGRTNRDFGVLARACHRIGADVLINGERPVDGVPPDPIRGKPRSTAATWTDVVRASVVAVPLARADGCFGITEVNDALGLGKPIVMTRNPFIDIDIEGVGCGRWVAPGDESGWAAAITEILSDPDQLVAMGDRAREYADRHWNYDHFCDALLGAVADLAPRR